MGNATSKYKFREAIHALSAEDVPPEDAAFWDELWNLKTTTEEVFEMISPRDVRKLKVQRPLNLQTLLDQAVGNILQVITNPLAHQLDKARNCVRVLTRLLPFMLEDVDDSFVHDLCWSVSNAEGASAESGTATDSQALPASTQSGQSLGQLILHAIMHLLFLPSFTVDAQAFDAGFQADAPPASALWAEGLIARPSDDVIVRSLVWDRNRVEVLRLMLAVLCEPLYQPADKFDPCRSEWLRTATAISVPHSSLLFYSLVNTIIGFDPVGWGVPYGASMSRSGAPTRLLEKALQVLIVLLDFGPQLAGVEEDQAEEEGKKEAKAAESGDEVPRNVYRELLADLGKEENSHDLDDIYNGIVRLLNNVHESLNVYLPGSVMSIECHQEVLVLLWKLLEENELFMPHILKNCDVTQLVIPVCYFMFEARRDPAKVGLVHICTFILLKLSGERNFCVQLNRTYTSRLPIELPLFSGTHTDLLVVVLHKMVVNGTDKLSPLYNCFLTIICNVSPYCKTLSLVSSVKLVNLFELFTSHRFLYAAEGNHVYVALLLEVFNNVVQYQYAGNPHLVYAIVRRKAIFDSLSKLTLPAALLAAEAQSRKNKREQVSAAPPTAVIGTQQQTETRHPNELTIDEPPAVAEGESVLPAVQRTVEDLPAPAPAADRESVGEATEEPPPHQPLQRRRRQMTWAQMKTYHQNGLCLSNPL